MTQEQPPMTVKVGRNDPCPCGSGKKHKHCCLQQQAPAAEPTGHDGAAKRVVDWLFERHRKAMRAALTGLLGSLLDDEQRDKLGAQMDEEFWVGMQINLMDWLVAEGELQIKGVRQRVSEYLLGPGGPLLTATQRDWLQQLAQSSLRLYDVTDVMPGVQMTLRDVLDADAAPIVVQERSGTQNLTSGMQLGCRVLRIREHFECSGSVCLFSMPADASVIAQLRAAAQGQGQREELATRSGMIIMSAWVRQYVELPPTPSDAHAGDTSLLSTDH
ncbi:hypothetical protein D5047_13485 [Verminephrobacter eiseniae]|nr:hypothetical protein [Verminephrobacter eiseniae]